MNPTQWIPAQEPYTPFVVPESPFRALQTLPRQQWLALRALPAAERRGYVANFEETFDWEALRPHLPLHVASLPDVPPWSGRRCRSHYRWLPPEETLTSDAWQGWDDCDLILRLFDFTAWRPIFAQRFRSHLGPPPFDTLSIGLGLLLARWRGWTPGKLAQELRSPERGRGYCLRLGIDPHDVPSESTFRSAHNAMSEEQFRQWEQSLVCSLLAYQLIPSHSTYPGDAPQLGVSLALDSQLVGARSHMKCHHQNARCFGPMEQRACAAQADGHEGCDCETEACRLHCRRATARDPEASYVYYSGSNQPAAAGEARMPVPLPRASTPLATRAKPSTWSTIGSSRFGRSAVPS